MKKSRVEDYDFKILVVLGNQTTDLVMYDHIKFLIVKYMLKLNYPLFYFIVKFKNSTGILREVYADMIAIKMEDCEYYIENEVMNDAVKLASLDVLVRHGMESNSLEFRQMCKNEFWERVFKFEDKSELIKKRNLDINRLRKVINRNRKGD